MSKTIDLQVEKSTRLIEALKAHIEEFESKGVSIGRLNDMAEQLRQLKESSEKADGLRSQLSAQVKNTNKILADCKAIYSETKSVVRNNYPQEEWIKYGVTDKR